MDHGKNDGTNDGSGDGTLGTNRLARETSPYLLQHRHNPVDWYPWGEEAFERARREDKPILLSVGYSACHWCHVMAHESFENESIASLMNRNFVNVKVDREERPDVDAVYMSAVQAMTGSGGWPMTVVMTPDGEPFFAGTYFPPEDRYGRPGFPRLLQSLAHAWSQRREEVLESAGSVREHLLRINRPAAGGGAPAGREASLAILDAALETLESSFDPRHGGFGGAPKFPPHGALRFLLLQDDERAWRMADLTLERMARGGIYDQLGGGFARYSVDERWLVPHFEKMLYDNAQLVQRYTEAYRRSGRDLHRRVVEETLAWVAREMTSPDGGFYSALDADSEGEEGRFYLWEQSEIRALLGDDAELFAVAYGVGAVGNFEGRTVLEAAADVDALAARFGLAEAEVEARLARARTTLFEAREARVRPGLDDKILTSWNGLMLAAYADAGRALQREDYLDAARRNAAFVRETLYRGGRLLHSFRAGEAKVAGLLEDYAYFGLGLLTLYRATFEREWLDFALELAAVVPLHFADADGGGFFSTPDDGEALLVRPKDYIDSATPGTNGAAAELLVHVARLTGEHALEELAAGAVAPMAEPMRKQPNAFGSLMVTLAFLLSPPREVALVGDPDEADTRALRAVLDERALPFTVLAHSRGPDDPLAEQLPFLRARGRVENRATAYVCEGGACRLPVVTPDALAEQLAEAGV